MIGEKIRQIRVVKGYSQHYVADLLEISQSAYSDIERGKTKVTLVRLKEIAEILELDVNFIMNFDENQFLSNPSQIKSEKSSINILEEPFNKEDTLYQDQINNLKNEIAHLKSKLDKILTI